MDSSSHDDKTPSHLAMNDLLNGQDDSQLQAYLKLSESTRAVGSIQICEELAFKLLSSLPRSRLAAFQRRLAPLLQFDVVGSLPTEISLQILSYLSYETLLICALVSRRWKTLVNDQTLWKALCALHGWQWRSPLRTDFRPPALTQAHVTRWDDSDDEGMGRSDEEDVVTQNPISIIGTIGTPPGVPYNDSGIASTFDASSVFSDVVEGTTDDPSVPPASGPSLKFSSQMLKADHQSSSIFTPSPDYKLLHQTHIRLRNRFLSSSFRLFALQTRGLPANCHTNTIYCLQLYTYPSTGRQVLFTGSRDKTIREWNLSTGLVERIISGVHTSSVLSICVYKGNVASAGSDHRVVLWNLEKNEPVKVLSDHEDSVLCVRFDDERLVSCSKDHTIRIYSYPDLKLQFTLAAHTSAVNAVSIHKSLIVSGSGDRSIRLWDATTGKLLRTFENHHNRGIASIDFKPPFILSGSSDRHVRLFNMITNQGWSTCPEYDSVSSSEVANLPFPLPIAQNSGAVCQSCGTSRGPSSQGEVPKIRHMHSNLVRTVALGEDFVFSGSYDLSIKVWDRKTGDLVADLKGGHTGRIFCVGFDRAKVVSCGEDQRICLWDFAHGIDTNHMHL